MKVYDSFGTFDPTQLKFTLSGKTTNIGTDIYEITNYYDISNENRFAILAILQTKFGNETNFRDFPADCAFLDDSIAYGDVNTDYLQSGDKNIYEAVEGDIIHAVVHHGIGFDPITNDCDNLYIENYKVETYTYYSKGSQPGRGGKGNLG